MVTEYVCQIAFHNQTKEDSIIIHARRPILKDISCTWCGLLFNCLATTLTVPILWIKVSLHQKQNTLVMHSGRVSMSTF